MCSSRERSTTETHLVIIVLKLAFMRPARMRTLTTYQTLMTMLSSLFEKVWRISVGVPQRPDLGPIGTATKQEKVAACE